MTADIEVLERLMRERRSERRFESEPIAQDVVERLLRAASTAPSASNRQPYRIMVIRSQRTKDSMATVVAHAVERGLVHQRDRVGAEAEAYVANFFYFTGAPVVFAVFFRGTNELLSGFRARNSADAVTDMREALSSASAAIMQLLLAAHAMGLGACWMTGPCLAEAELLKLLRVPEGWRLAAIIPMGRSADCSAAPKRRSIARLQIPEPSDQDTAECP